MECKGCGNQEALAVRVKWIKGRRSEVCDLCGGIHLTDAFGVSCPSNGYFDENLADKEHRRGQWVKSKAHKKELLRKLNLEEAGSQRNSTTGKVTPYIKDPEKRRRYCIENFGG